MGAITEYFGLPGSGKSWQLENDGYCSSLNAMAHTVPEGKGLYKLKTTFLGIMLHKYLFVLLIITLLKNRHSKNIKISIRPVFVVFERLGRIYLLKRSLPDKDVHIDEGFFQFMWRVFSDLEKTPSNIKMLGKCIKNANVSKFSVAYIESPEQNIYFEQIRNRNKKQIYDQSIINGNMIYYNLSRYWMAQVLKYARSNSVNLAFVKNTRGILK